MGTFPSRPPDSTPNGALCELLKTDSLYASPGCKVEDYDESKVKFFQSDIIPRPIEDLAPDSVRQAFLNPDGFIRKSGSVVERDLDGHAPVRPYWDERLRSDPAEHIRFVQLLARKGLVDFRPRIPARVGCFFVSKKGNKQRFVIDAQETNRMHFALPHAALGAPDALADQDWSDAAFAAANNGEAVPSPAVFGASLDLRDSFYQFSSDVTAGDFGFDFPEQAGVWGVTSYWTPDGPQQVSPEQELFPVFRGVPMGWSWALWAVHSTVAHWTARALGGANRLVMDRLAPPTPAPGRPTASVYVGNVVVLGLSPEDSNAGFRLVRKRLHDFGFATHEEKEASSSFTAVGVQFDGGSRRVRATDAKAWRLYLACRAMESAAPRSALQVQAFLGHCIQHCLFMRPATRCFRELCAFIDCGDGSSPAAGPGASRDPDLQGLAMVFLGVIDLGAPTSEEVFCSDASEAGYGLHVARIPGSPWTTCAPWRATAGAGASCRRRSGPCSTRAASPLAGFPAPGELSADLLPALPRCGAPSRGMVRSAPGSTTRTTSAT